MRRADSESEVLAMAHKSIKTEHAGAKNKGRKTGYFGLRVDAKRESNRRRRENSKRVVREES